MKVLILSCLVALALAKQNEEIVFSENVEKLSSPEETIMKTIKEKIEKLKFEEQQPKEDEDQNKMHPVFQQLSQFYSNAMPFPYTAFPQNFLPLAQHAVVPSSFQPETVENIKAKETFSSNCKAMPFPKSPIAPSFEHQFLNFTDLESLHFALPLFQSLMQQFTQPIPQIPMFPPQSWLTIPQPKFLLAPQQEMPYTHTYMPFQTFPLTQEPLFYRAHKMFYL
ncbi:beta-casein [Sorex fumeus]|uniref:beta-casein n=1 Tax=Sorex fumeus TaxID=62283 RepID=UPI0024ADF51E|nr:beta-casein [Sorex fumeus]